MFVQSNMSGAVTALKEPKQKSKESTKSVWNMSGIVYETSKCSSIRQWTVPVWTLLFVAWYQRNKSTEEQESEIGNHHNDVNSTEPVTCKLLKLKLLKLSQLETMCWVSWLLTDSSLTLIFCLGGGTATGKVAWSLRSDFQNDFRHWPCLNSKVCQWHLLQGACWLGMWLSLLAHVWTVT